MQIKEQTQNPRRGLIVLALICAFMQLAVVPHLPFGLGRANMALIFCLIAASQYHLKHPAVVGFCAGLFYDLATTGPIGLMSFCLTISCFVLSQLLVRKGRSSSSDCIALCGIALVVVLAVYHLTMLAVGQSKDILGILGFRFIPSLLVSILFSLPFLIYYLRFRGRTAIPGGGMKLGTKRSSQRGLHHRQLRS